MFCLIKEQAEKLKQAIKNGDFDPNKLAEMKSSQEARDYFAKIVGEENAKQVNLLYEKKLLLKNQEQAQLNFYREVLGDKKFQEYKEELAKQARDRAELRKQKVFSPKENERMLDEIAADAYSKKYDTEITLEQAQTITELGMDMKDARDKLGEDFGGTKQKITPESMDYGAKKTAYDNYIASLEKNINERNLVNPLRTKGAIPKIEAVIEDARISVNFIADTSRKLVAGILDNSFWGNQGSVLLMDPKYTGIWWKNLKKSITDIGYTLKSGIKQGEAIIDGAKAMTYAEPLYIDGTFENKGGIRLDIFKGEEEIPSVLLKKVPIAGRLEKAADVAYEVGAVRVRIDTAKKLYKMYEELGLDIKDKDVRSGVNQQVNSMTGRGNIGRFEKVSKEINTMFFAAKYFKSTWDVSTAHIFDSRISPEIKLESAKSLLRILSTGAVITGMAYGLGKVFGQDDVIELNPLSSDFTKIKVGDTRVGIPFITRMASIITLISRITAQKTKSSTTGITTNLGEGYGSKTGMDVFWDFTENKFSPLLSILRDLAAQKTFEGEKPTLINETLNSTVPMAGQQYAEIWKDKTIGDLLKAIYTVLAAGGINFQSYSSKTDWGQNTGVELQQFKEKVGDDKFKEANELFNQQYNDWLSSEIKKDEYKNLSDEDKQKLLTKNKAEIKDEVFKQYGFEYEAEKKPALPKK